MLILFSINEKSIKKERKFHPITTRGEEEGEMKKKRVRM